MSNENSPVDLSKLSLAMLVTHAPLYQVVGVIIAILGAGYAAGSFSRSLSETEERASLKTEIAECKRLDRNGPFGAIPTTPQDIFKQAAPLHHAQELEKALMVYRLAETVDRIGRDPYTASSYFAIADISQYLAKTKFGADPERRKFLEKDFTRYSAAHAAAVECSKGNCEISRALWGK